MKKFIIGIAIPLIISTQSCVVESGYTYRNEWAKDSMMCVTHKEIRYHYDDTIVVRHSGDTIIKSCEAHTYTSEDFKDSDSVMFDGRGRIHEYIGNQEYIRW